MFRFLKGRFSPDDAVSFRELFLKIARDLHPQIAFQESPDSPEIVVFEGKQIGLQNIRARYEQSDRSTETLRTLIQAHLSLLLKPEPSAGTFEEAQKNLRPQIMPPEYAQKVPIISFPFGHSLAIGLVLDLPESYLYVKIEDATRWGKSEAELLDNALANLEVASRGMKISGSENGEVKFVGIEVKDGFDAVRILMPRLQGMLAQTLGTPFHFGIPNRDFLICWNNAAPVQFQQMTRAKLEKDFTNQPYPLSPHIFTVAADGTITEE